MIFESFLGKICKGHDRTDYNVLIFLEAGWPIVRFINDCSVAVPLDNIIIGPDTPLSYDSRQRGQISPAREASGLKHSDHKGSGLTIRARD